MRICGIEGCGQPWKARDWCGTHYARWRKTGDPFYVRPKIGPADWKHGSYSTYTSHKCRCDECRAAARAYNRSRKPTNPDDAALRNLKNLLRYQYGLELADYERMREKQGDRCAICGDPAGSLTSRKQRLCVDHCHDSGVVRGLLCLRCNTAIGMLRDSPDIIRAALAYVEQHAALKVVA